MFRHVTANWHLVSTVHGVNEIDVKHPYVHDTEGVLVQLCDEETSSFVHNFRKLVL